MIENRLKTAMPERLYCQKAISFPLWTSRVYGIGIKIADKQGITSRDNIHGSKG